MNCVAAKKLLLFSSKPKTRHELGSLNVRASDSICIRLTGCSKPVISAIVRGKHVAMQANEGDLGAA